MLAPGKAAPAGGFASDIDLDNSDLVAKNISSVEALLSYINRALLQEDTIEFYTCWAGNQWQEPQERREERINEVIRVGFELEENIFLTFTQR